MAERKGTSKSGRSRPGEGFYLRGSTWWVRTDPITGREASTGETSITAAREWLASRRAIAGSPVLRAAEGATLGEWLSRYLGTKVGRVSEGTIDALKGKAGPLLRVFGAAHSLLDITPGRVDSYVELRRSEDVKDISIRREVSLLRSTLYLAKRAGAYAGELDVLMPLDLRSDYVPKERALTPEEVAALMHALPPDRAAVVAVCVALGTRRAEAWRLRPEHINLTAGTVRVPGTKTKGANRELPLVAAFRPLVEAALPYLPLAPWKNVWRDMGAACARANIRPCSLNDLRRTHATLLLEGGVPSDTVWRMLGHTSSQMVDRVYGKPRPSALGARVEERSEYLPVFGQCYKSATSLPQGSERYCSGNAKTLEIFQGCGGATFRIRTGDLRFTKPTDPELDAHLYGNFRGLLSVGADENRWGATGTATSALHLPGFVGGGSTGHFGILPHFHGTVQ